MSTSARTATSRTAASDVRWVRAVAFATASVALASAAHSAAGGQVAPGWVLTGWLLVALTAAAGAGRRRSMPAITAAVTSAQLVLHLLFRAGHAPMTPTGAGDVRRPGSGAALPVAHQGHGGSHSPAVHLHAQHGATAVGAVHAASHHAGLLGLSSGMLAAHAAAAAATGWLLHRVEAALWRLLDVARAMRAAARRWRGRFAEAVARLCGSGTAQVPRAARVVRAPLSGATPHRPVLLRHSLVRRGPPGRVCV